ncbi:MAG: hypothetical protein JSR86_16820 [Proteobacteria bacterium]|nr:hypothetical protein [Pseudomonadota bacterium]
MADIRPPNWPVAGAGGALVPQKGTGTQRAEAQRAFFQAALSAQGVSAPQPPPAPVAAQAAASRPTDARAPDLTIKMPEPPTDEEPRKILRPGSIIDIRV